MPSNKSKSVIIAIDGPAGAGKSTIARLIALKLGFLYIDTGAIYRAITLMAIQQKADFTNEFELIKLAKKAGVSLKNEPSGQIKVFLNGRDVSQDIRTPQVARYVSDAAKISGVRKEVLKIERKAAAGASCVLDGRDIGTVVFPNADCKFFLDAKFQERVKRRYKELKERGLDIKIEDTENDLANRDTIDSTRACAPLRKAKDAICIDTTDMNIQQVVEKVLGYIHKV